MLAGTRRQHPSPTCGARSEEALQCQSPLIPAARYRTTGGIPGGCVDGPEHVAEASHGSDMQAADGTASEKAMLEADVFGMMRELMSCQAETMELLELDHHLHEQLLNESSGTGAAHLGCPAAQEEW
jgi:hypothetical protein